MESKSRNEAEELPAVPCDRIRGRNPRDGTENVVLGDSAGMWTPSLLYAIYSVTAGMGSHLQILIRIVITITFGKPEEALEGDKT